MIRTRFAPSPTGYMHIGNLRTALYEYLIAKASAAPEGKGVFVLRIEDTDVERFVPGATEIILNTLNKTGLIPDEGPGDIGGDYAPYVQSERMDIYLEYAEKLIASGHAYYCFCDKERLSSLKKEAGGEEILKYDRKCLSLTESEINDNLKNGVPHVIRQKMPQEGETTFSDLVFGDITVPNSEMEDQILIKSDGYPTYNFANVIDDHLMDITHVVRGSEYLSSAPKYNLLYEAFGWEIPKYVHCPPVMKDAQNKLSKRKGDPSFEDLLEMGFLPDAVLNFIALLGWSPPDNREFLTLADMEECFQIASLSKAPSIFDMTKLLWMNGEYIKKMDFDEFFALTENTFKQAVGRAGIDLRYVAQMVKTRIQTLNEIPEHIGFIDVLPDYDIQLYVNKKMKTDEAVSLESLIKAHGFLETLDESDFTAEVLHDKLLAFIKETGVKNGQVLWPLRTALSGRETSFGGAIELLAVFGKNESLNRIKRGIEKLQ